MSNSLKIEFTGHRISIPANYMQYQCVLILQFKIIPISGLNWDNHMRLLKIVKGCDNINGIKHHVH